MLIEIRVTLFNSAIKEKTIPFNSRPSPIYRIAQIKGTT
jgi:hypothetical protein